MQEHQLVVIADPAREVLARIIAVSIPADSEITGVHFSRPLGAEASRTLLSVRVPTSQRLKLVVARIERVVAVRSVAVLDGTCRSRLSKREVCSVP
jgi:acetolactate synthase regulatory subunit